MPDAESNTEKEDPQIPIGFENGTSETTQISPMPLEALPQTLATTEPSTEGEVAIDGGVVAISSSLPTEDKGALSFDFEKAAGDRDSVVLHCTYPEPKPPAEVPVAGNLLLARVLQHGHREAGSSPCW